MESNSTKEQALLRPSKWAAGTTAMILSMSLILSACGGSSQPVVESTPVATMAAPEATPADADAEEAPAEEEAPEEEAAPAEEATEAPEEEAAGAPDVSDSEAVTETEGVDDSEGMTETEGVDDSEGMTETEGVDDSEGMTETEGVDDSEVMTETGATDGAAASTASSAGMGVSGVDSQYVRASTLLDYDFENMGGEVSGDLEDLLIDLPTGRVLFASIEYGGVLDLGDKDIVVPLNAFAIGPEGELVLNIDEAVLENYPDVGNNWPDLSDPLWDDDVWTFWGETGIETGTNFEEATTSVAWASELMGHNIADLGFGAGSVLDILVNLGTGQAPYLIVDYGEGLDTDPYIIPLAAYDTANWSEELAYGPDFTPDMLENAPRFDQDMYPEGSPLDNDFGDNVESWWNDMGFSNDLNNDGEID